MPQRPPENPFLTLMQRYRDDPVAFAKEVIGLHPDEWQEELLRAIADPDKRRITVRSGHGVGKSTAVAHALGAISGKNAIVRVGRFPLQRGELLDLLFDHMRIQQRPQRGNQP